MATFYLLPPRAEMARRWADSLRATLPDVADLGPELADHLALVAEHQPGVYVVFADDLPDEGDVRVLLQEGFGADADDRVIDLRSGPLAAAA